MKKTFLYLSFFAAAFLVSCKSNEVEETPVVEETPTEIVEETVVEEPVQEETSAIPAEKTKKPTASKDPKITLETTTPTSTNSKTGGSKVKDAQTTKELSNTSGEKTVETTGRPSKVKATIESGQ